MICLNLCALVRQCQILTDSRVGQPVCMCVCVCVCVCGGGELFDVWNNYDELYHTLMKAPLVLVLVLIPRWRCRKLHNVKLLVAFIHTLIIMINSMQNHREAQRVGIMIDHYYCY